MAMIDQLKTIRLNKEAIQPDAKLQQTLKEGIAEAHAWMDNQYDASFTATAEYPGGHWALPVSKDLIKATTDHFADTNVYPTDSRGIAYSYAFFSPRHLGAGQYYLFAIQDKDGNAFDGANSYRLHVPPNVPVKQYWSVTAYDRRHHGLIRDTKCGRAVRRRQQVCKKMPMAQSISTSRLSRRTVKNRTGSRPARLANSKRSSVFTVLRRHSSIKREGCRTLKNSERGRSGHGD
jgi:hypothetical protein